VRVTGASAEVDEHDPDVEPVAQEAAPHDDEEKIEVHVHVHRGEKPQKVKKKKRVRRSRLTGVLFDWQAHYDRMTLRPTEKPKGRWARAMTCHNCGERVPFVAKTCQRCGAPRSYRGISKLIAALAVGIVAGVFGLCAHVLGDSVAEHRNPPPVMGDYYEEMPYIIEVPVQMSPLYDNSYNNQFVPSYTGSYGSGLATR
jgi:hypothetical protein